MRSQFMTKKLLALAFAGVVTANVSAVAPVEVQPGQEEQVLQVIETLVSEAEKAGLSKEAAVETVVNVIEKKPALIGMPKLSKNAKIGLAVAIIGGGAALAYWQKETIKGWFTPKPAASVNPPATGTPATGTPATGTPATGTPATGTPATGTPATGTPATGTPANPPANPPAETR
jgi:hypothetical protein